MDHKQRTIAFINSLDKGNSPFLYELEKYAKETDVPIIRKHTESLLRFLLAEHQPKRILEVGTAIGYSALIMHAACPEAHITTIEKYEKRIPLARENFKKANAEDAITLIEGDAMEVLQSLEGTYDFIFMDAAKGQYIHFLPEIMRLLPKGGLLVSDNVLQDGDLIESRYAVTRRDRTIHARMREYLYTLTHSEELQTVILSDGDGVSLSVKR